MSSKFNNLVDDVVNSSIVPTVSEPMPKEGDSRWDIYSKLLKDRIIMFFSGVDDHVASLVVSQLLFLESEDPKKDIWLYINSPGGLVTAGLGIYDTMQYVRPKVGTLCIGQAASMGSLLLCAGHAGMRYALPHSRIMLHQPMGGAQGQATDIKIQANEIGRLKKTLNTIYSHHAGADISEIEEKLDRDNFLCPEEAMKFGSIGIIDRIMGDKAEESVSTERSDDE